MGTNLSCCSASPVSPTDTNPTDTNQSHRPVLVAPTDTSPVNTNESRPRSVSPSHTSTNESVSHSIGPMDTNLMGSNQSLPRPRSGSSTDTISTNQSRPRPRSVSPTHTNPMGSNQSLPRPRSVSSTDTSSIDTKQRRFPNIQFRVLIIGRANAGKTTILQRVCDTTESPTIYRRNGDGEREQVRPGGLTILPISSNATQVTGTLEPSMEVSDKRCCLLPVSLLNSDSAWRARYR